MLFKITNGGVSFGADTVLERVDFEIRDREKIAIVGRNGAGKTTLLKCVSGEIAMEEGTGEEAFSISKTGNPTIGYLKQITFEDQSVSMLDEILKVFKPLLEIESKMQTLLVEMETSPTEDKVKTYSNLAERFEFLGGYTYKKEYSVMIKKFGFTEEDKAKPLSEFSGGQQTKIAFIKLLLSHPDVLLLDEPTNHLDAQAQKWLEGYIKAYKSAVVIVSHDRMFVEKTVDKVYEIEYGETKCYHGNYSEFERQKRENYQKQLKDHEYQREEIARITALIERFRYKATKAKMVQSKIKMLERMKKVDRPDRYDLKTFHADFQPKELSAKQALLVKDLAVGYDTPLATVNLELNCGQKLGVIGDNGVGKSTFLKTLVGEIKALSGRFTYGVRVQVGYFSQQMAQYSSDKSVLDDFHDVFPTLTEGQVRTALGAFQFTGEDVFKCVNDLSGGERVRLALCKILKRRPNFLILDEPTNHMDIVGKETLEQKLKEYEGTIIFVSHDRYFVNKIADRLLVMQDGNATFYPYGYSQYELEEKEREEREQAQERQEKQASSIANAQSGGKKTFSTPLKDKSRKERRVKRLEELIENAQLEIDSLNKELEKPEVYSDYKRVEEIQGQLDKLIAQREEYSEEWLILSEELENI